MKLSEHGAELIANYEGFRAEPYWDVDHYSIGFGTRARREDVAITRAEGYHRLRSYVEEHVGPAVRELKPFGQHQFDALCSFAYNLGAGVLDGQVGDLVREGDYRLAGDAMLNYTRVQQGSHLVVLPGLVRRREAERRLLMKVRYTKNERDWLGVLRDRGARESLRNTAAAYLRQQAHDIQTAARREKDWAKNDRGRRYKGIRQSLRRHAP